MKNLKILNTREVKEIIKKLEEYYGISLKTFQKQYAFIKNQHDRIFIVNRDVEKIDFENLRINTVGLYFAEINKYGEVRLTLEGSQLIGPLAKKNTLELTEEQVREYFKGHEIEMEIETDQQPLFLIHYQKDFFGAAKYKNGTLLNYLPKIHRTQELIL
jgi:NOL1/NOP2/fmu family ribosome biogenesis protein